MTQFSAVMPGLDPDIHDFLTLPKIDVDGRDEPGHDDVARALNQLKAE